MGMTVAMMPEEIIVQIKYSLLQEGLEREMSVGGGSPEGVVREDTLWYSPPGERVPTVDQGDRVIVEVGHRDKKGAYRCQTIFVSILLVDSVSSKDALAREIGRQVLDAIDAVVPGRGEAT